MSKSLPTLSLGCDFLRQSCRLKPAFRLLPLSLGSLLLFSSCAQMKDKMASLDLPKLKAPNFKKLLPVQKSDIPVVAVRPEDLEKVDQADAKALAYQKRQSELTNIALPRDFEPADLPTDDGLPGLGILPPLTPGTSSAIDVDTPLPALDPIAPAAPSFKLPE